MKRASGVLLHISSLPGPFGIGTFGRSAYKFVDFLVKTGQTYWQILPLSPTSYGDSPYQSFSAFAGNTHFIDLDLLHEAGYLEAEEYQSVHFGADPTDVDYSLLYEVRRPILQRAVERFLMQEDQAFVDFVEEERDWLIPFAQFMTIKETQGMKPWYEWEDERLRAKDHAWVETVVHEHRERYHYYLVTQYFFHKQWSDLKAYANHQHIQIIGDVPIYVAHDSVEMWATPELFLVDDARNPVVVAGTPPDYFSQDGQYWGNPIYDWDYHHATQYAWWTARMRANLKLYDVIRIDHFRGFEAYWAVPYADDTAINGEWRPGPGLRLFQAMTTVLGPLPIIAEDLGVITDAVDALRLATGYPGMRVLQFGFTGSDRADSDNLPHHYEKNMVAYVSTHDNETARGWYDHTASDAQRMQADRYLHRQQGETPTYAMNRTIAASVCDTAIYTMQDLLDLGDFARMNQPNTLGKNWRWRMEEAALTNHKVETELLQLTRLYFRMNDAQIEGRRGTDVDH